VFGYCLDFIGGGGRRYALPSSAAAFAAPAFYFALAERASFIADHIACITTWPDFLEGFAILCITLQGVYDTCKLCKTGLLVRRF